MNKNKQEMSIENGRGAKAPSSKAFKHYKMESIFDENVSNAEIFHDFVKEKLQILKTERNVCMMAYGATNSGKTHTIFGYQNQPGLAFLCFDHLLKNFGQDDKIYFLSYIQVYNQNVYDLLRQDSKESLHIFQDNDGKTTVHQLNNIEVENFEHLESLIRTGNALRNQGSNFINSVSSRSHAILQLQIQSKRKVKAGSVPTKLTIVDLAGSQKYSIVDSIHLRQAKKSSKDIQSSNIIRQGSNINRSLLALGSCINSLQKGESHIPYRDSKLTRILKDSFEGESHNILLACISQNVVQYDESLSTLSYAMKAQKIKCENKNLYNGKDRQKYVKIQCQFCKMGNQYAVIKDELEFNDFRIVDKLNQPKSIPIKSTTQNYLIERIIQRLKKKSDEELIQFEKIIGNFNKQKEEEQFHQKDHTKEATMKLKIRKKVSLSKNKRADSKSLSKSIKNQQSVLLVQNKKILKTAFEEQYNSNQNLFRYLSQDNFKQKSQFSKNTQVKVSSFFPQINLKLNLKQLTLVDKSRNGKNQQDEDNDEPDQKFCLKLRPKSERIFGDKRQKKQPELSGRQPVKMEKDSINIKNIFTFRNQQPLIQKVDRKKKIVVKLNKDNRQGKQNQFLKAFDEF